MKLKRFNPHWPSIQSSWIALALFSLSGIAEEAAPRFSIPQENHQFSFPEDHGSHPDFKIEWWYLTGHLFSGDERFGFQATFFRLAQSPEDIPEGELFGNEQIYMAHMAISDASGKRFIHESRFNRGGWNAFSRMGKLDVRNGNWSLSGSESEMMLTGSIRSEAAFSLTLNPAKSLVVFGENGVSRKGAAEEAASYYLTFPRIDAKGTLRISGRDLEVKGEVWMDHEVSSSQLDRNQVGWDWVSIQLFDGREIMGYLLRNEDGSVSEFSKIVWIDEEGNLTNQLAEDFTWIPGGEWESPKTGAVYPISPSIETTDPKTGDKLVLKVQPLFPEQEMAAAPGGVSYWEGACDILDSTQVLIGRGYLELTGYVGDLAERLR